MKFKLWLEEKNREYYRDMILSKLDLDKDKGLSQSLNVWDSDKLLGKLSELGEYKSLPEDVQKSIEAKIKSGSGTISDLINIISNKL